jgi:hypothetical protein
MRTASLRSIPLLLVVLVCCACSFRGSVGRADGTSSSSSGSEHSTSSSSAPATSTAGASGTTGAAGSTTPEDGTPAGVDRCHTSELAGSLVPGSPGAGQRYATLVLRNSGGEVCTIHGYGGLGLVDGDGHALPTHQVRLSDPPAATVTLQPGDTVSAQLHWGAVPGPGDATSGDCQPTPATLRVIPPDETDALSVAWDQGPVCEGGSIEQTAYAG